jgi:hypothetical protein
LYARADAQSGNLKRQCVARNNGLAKTSLADPGKQYQLRIAIFDFTQRQHCSHLRQRLYNQHARHYRCAGKVPLKERLVYADLFDTNDALAWNQFNYPIHQQERITMREYFLYGLGIENSWHDIQRRGTRNLLPHHRV